MTRRRMSTATAFLVAALLVPFIGTAIVLTQVAAGPFGVADATARKLLVDAILIQTFRTYQADIGRNDLIATVARAYARMPAAARGPATTAAFTWARAYLSSPAFAAAYAKVRDEQRPAGVANQASVDDTLKKMMDEQWAALEQTRKMAAGFPEKERAGVLAMIKESEARLKSPETVQIWRAAVEAEQGVTAASGSKALADWEARYPASPNAFVREHLQLFLAETANVDFTLAAFMVRGPGGEVLGFLSPGYMGIPWQHVHAIVAGREALDAGRAAAAAWLKELDAK